MALAAYPSVGLDQTRFPNLGGVDHDLGWPIVGTGTVARLALNSRQSGGAGGVAPQTGRGLTFDTQASGRSAVGGCLPTQIGGTVTKLAALGTDEGSLVDAQTKKGNERNEPTSAESIRHPFLRNRLARANPERQGFGHIG
jgi:hypothetical protein